MPDDQTARFQSAGYQRPPKQCAQANAIQQRIQRGGPPFLGGPGMGFPRGRFVHPPRFVGPLGPPGFFGAPRPFGYAGPLAGATRYLGLAPSQLFKDLRSGRSLAEIATAHGRSQEAQLLSTLSARLRNLINRAGMRPGPASPPAWQFRAPPSAYPRPAVPSGPPAA